MVTPLVQMMTDNFRMPMSHDSDDLATNYEMLVPAGCERDNGRVASGFWRQPRRWPGLPTFPTPPIEAIDNFFEKSSFSAGPASAHLRNP